MTPNQNQPLHCNLHQRAALAPSGAAPSGPRTCSPWTARSSATTRPRRRSRSSRAG